jgi:uncharacterized membrane protein
MTSQPFFIPSILTMIFALPMAFGWVPRNPFWGIRTQKAMADEEIWYTLNRFGGLVLVASGLIYIIVAGLLPCAVPCGLVFSQWLVHLAAFLGPLLVSLGLIRAYGKTL